MIGLGLAETGVAGDPLEYLNLFYVQAYAKRSGISDPEEFSRSLCRSPDTLFKYLAFVEARRTSPNGVFGLKLHHSQFASIFNDKPEVGRA